ncbi:hypothetical protein KGF57_002931 [Candida theae]|uniref:BZIP domain-containing protein n=1 Tax=Candida theae TaxID=1198502 RepID=A0AAD5BF71_9ASCO|nr:uncharacterized protein KGF57_002931 [Candida theae]KAI5958123.1 hypothetical protein KGF57_002931 [Candida theae]
MSAKGPSIAPRQSPVAQSPIAIAGSPPSSASAGSTPKSIASPNTHSNNTASSSPNRHDTATANPTTTPKSLNTKGLTSIMTSKEWVLPPRPKPGRKPSVDTPASKRKAQNRAAQRAFRERRATRVQELEEKLMEVEKEKDIKEMALINTINKLKAENSFLTKSMEQVRQEMAMFRASQEEMRQQLPLQHAQSHQQHSSPRMHNQQQQSIAPAPVPPPPQQQQQQFFKRQSRSTTSYSQFEQQQQQQQQYYTSNSGQNSSPLNNISPTGSSYSLQQISPAPSADSPPNVTSRNNFQPHSTISRNNSSNSNQTQHTLTPVSNNTTPDKAFASGSNGNTGAIDASEFDCGVCIKDECLCESVGLKEPRKTGAELELENQLSSIKPQPAVSLSRKRKAQSVDDVQEIDFTRQFSTKAKPMPDLTKLRKQEQNSRRENTGSSVTRGVLDQSKPQSKSGDGSSEFNEDSPMENCGFCSDDTPCVCREAAKEAARLNASLNGPDNIIVEEDEEQHADHEINEQDGDENTLPPLQFNLTSNNNTTKMALPVMHPGPSVEIRDITNLTPGAVPTIIPRPNQSSSDTLTSQQTQSEEDANTNGDSGSGCTGNPGTCRQCQMDPMSTLFCTTVASKSRDSSIRSNLSRNPSRTSLSLNFGPNTPSATLLNSNSSNDSNSNNSNSNNSNSSNSNDSNSNNSNSNNSNSNDSNNNNNYNNNNNNSNAPSPIPPPLIASNSTTNIAASPGGGVNGLSAFMPTTPGSGSSGSDGTGGGMFIPCADAYKTLSRHKKFNSVDFSTLVGKLTTRGMQVEVQSVANVLRELDRRLYN